MTDPVPHVPCGCKKCSARSRSDGDWLSALFSATVVMTFFAALFGNVREGWAAGVLGVATLIIAIVVWNDRGHRRG